MRDGQLLRAAVVLFGRAERLEEGMPQCLLRVARFRGRDKTEFLDNRQFAGNAFELLHVTEGRAESSRAQIATNRPLCQKETEGCQKKGSCQSAEQEENHKKSPTRSMLVVDKKPNGKCP